MIEHEFEPLSGRCVHCGTTTAHHGRAPQPCVPSHTRGEVLRPEPARREYASEAWGEIGSRVAELRAERDIILNTPAKDDAS